MISSMYQSEPFPPERYARDPADLAGFDADRLMALADAVMPFGRYAGTRLVDLPEAYVLWFRQQGWPAGELGRMLAEVAEIKANGLEFLFEPLRFKGREAGGRS